MQAERFTIRWDESMGCYRVSIPNLETAEVVRAEDHDAVVTQLREALRLIAEGHIAPAHLARMALDSPHGIGTRV